jgi:hypothetical protein
MVEPLVFAHETARLFNARGAFGVRDRLDAVGHRFEVANDLGDRRGLGRCRAGAGRQK